MCRRPPGNAALLLVVVTLGCDAGKGSEDDPFGDGKADSFFNPTQHGELLFGGVRNHAEITADELFHAWTFELDGPATFSIRTEITGDLDTVMYLYRRDLGSDGLWGRFVAKNDDHEGELFSQIDHAGDRGEYRIIVKGFKSAHRGPFAVVGECAGDGCPSPPTCHAGSFDPLPASTNLTGDCAAALLAAVAAGISAEDASSAQEAEVCSLEEIARRAVDLYRGYFDELFGWDSFKDGADDVELDVSVRARGAATEVVVEAAEIGGDPVSFFFGEEDELLLLFDHNRHSSEVRGFCDRPGGIAPPGERCAEEMLQSLSHVPAAEVAGAGMTDCASSLESSLPLLVADPVCEFTFRAGLPDDAPVSVQFRTWTSESGLLGAEVALESQGLTGTFYLGTTFRSTTVLFATDQGGAIRFECLEL